MLVRLILLSKHVLRLYATQAQPAEIPKVKWKSVVGLEVHAQIASESKLFSGSATKFEAPLNTTVSYFDASLPGTLPVLNRKCVELAVKTALALNCKVNEISIFDRKHYFYADLPNGYQITQQRAALANNGLIQFPVVVPGSKTYYKTARLLQLQLEQDSGKSMHDDYLKRSMVDLNRAGVPLMELVFAPDLETGEEAASLIKELVLILRRLQTCSCKMEEGALRVDANISIHKKGDPLGVRTEVKNIGSIRNISQAISYEIQRQRNLISNGDEIINETRSWDAIHRCTSAMRDKEVLQDYRFMPEPNLPPLRLSMVTDIKKEKGRTLSSSSLISVPDIMRELPELPEQTRTRLVNSFNLKGETAIILVNEPVLLDHFEKIIIKVPKISGQFVANFLINELLTYYHKSNIALESSHITSIHLRDILKTLYENKINLHGAKHLIELIHEDFNKNVNELIDEYNLVQISDMKIIENFCLQAINNHTKAVKQYRGGKTKALYAIVGEVAKLSENRANMKIVVECLERLMKT